MSAPPKADLALAGVLTAFAQLDLFLNFDQSTHYGSTAVVAVATAIATGALAFRRRAPLATACVVAIAVAVPELVTVLTITLWGDFVPLLIAAYSVARYGRREQAIAGAAAIGAAVAVVFARVPSIGTASNIPFSLVPLAVVLVAGRALRQRQQREEVAVGEAVAEERTRIARELHDIVAHCVSVMVIQAGAAEDLLDRDPERAHAPLQSVQDTGRQTIAELQRMLGLLRNGAVAPALNPQPGTAQLSTLVHQMNDIGLPVELTVEGCPRPLSPGVELAVYRVAQEALTNTVKHAGPATARVVLRYSDDAVELEVIDDGCGPGGRDGGHGLIGMRERAALYGGTLQVGPLPRGGFCVRLALPVMDSAR